MRSAHKQLYLLACRRSRASIRPGAPSFTFAVRHLRTSGATSPVTPSRRPLLDLALIALAGTSVCGLLLAYRGKGGKDMSEGSRGVFTIPVVSQSGSHGTKTLTLLSESEIDTLLRSNEASYSVSRRSNPVFRYDTNSLPSNSPIEDDSACVILERDPQSKTKGDLMFWGVFDGHSGWQTSKLLSTKLVSYVARELDLVYRSAPPYSTTFYSAVSSSPSQKLEKVWQYIAGPSDVELDKIDKIVKMAIERAFLTLDREIVQTPLDLLRKHQTGGPKGKAKDESMSGSQIEALNALLPAISGSCALLAFLDTSRRKLHVACTGDSRAVLGVWDGKGKWRTQVLSEDQTGKNPKEVQRMRSEHPAAEEDTVVIRGRVLGSLEPTRAFGDARYKWPIGVQEKLADAFHPGQMRGRPKSYLSPPYVTAKPEVVTIDLTTKSAEPVKKSLASLLPVTSSADPSPPAATKFLVLATDGLYDRLTNDEIVALVGAHLQNKRGTLSRKEVMGHIDASPAQKSTGHTTHSPRDVAKADQDFVFEDGNLSTHLIRNALGGAKRDQVSALLSIPAPLSRRYRDDTTVTVVLVGDETVDGGFPGVHRRDDDSGMPIKSKL